jgi:hypothetical protein
MQLLSSLFELLSSHITWSSDFGRIAICQIGEGNMWQMVWNEYDVQNRIKRQKIKCLWSDKEII